MQKITKYFLQYFVLFLFFVLLYYICYFFNYLKYNDQDAVFNNTLVIENNYLKDSINNIDEIKNIVSLYDYSISKVINKDLYNLNNKFIIKSYNYNKGDIVINGTGLVGFVDEINEDKCFVKTLNNDINLSVKINDYYGILNNGVISMINKYANIKIGDNVFTSGLTNVPSDIYVGEIVKVYSSNDDLGLVAIVKLNNYNNLNYVGVLGVNDDY